MGSFAIADNEFIDYPTPATTPVPWMIGGGAVKTPEFLDTYLAFRTPPRLRPNPRRPYAGLDVLVGDELKAGASLSPLQLLDIALLFPPSLSRALLRSRADELAVPLAGLRKAVDAGDEDLADAIDVLLGVAEAGEVDSVLAALSGTRDVREAVTLLHRWRLSLTPSEPADSDFVVNAVQALEKILSGTPQTSVQRGRQPAADPAASAEALVRGMMPDAKPDAIRDALAAAGNNPEAAVGLLLDEADGGSGSGGALVAIGKRTERRRHVRKVDESATFTGDQAEADGGYGWLKARMDAELARQALIDPDDPRESKRIGSYSFLIDAGDDGMYDDDPDDAALEGEEPLGRTAAAAARPGFIPNGGDSSTDEDDDESDADDGGDTAAAAAPRMGSRGGRGAGSGGRGGHGSSGAAGASVGGRGAAGPSGRGRGRGGGGDSGRGGGSWGVDDGGRGQGRGGGRGSGRGRGRGRGGAHGRRDGAAKKQARAGM